MGISTDRTCRQLRSTMLGLACIAAVGCTPINRFHGFTPSEAELSEVQVGQTTRGAVVEAFGPPTSQGALQNDKFYYVSSQFRYVGAFAPQEVKREVLAISFTPQGVVSNIARYGLEDGNVVTLDRRVTDDGINDVTFIGQLLGSFGRIDAGALLGDEPDS
ncbi:outer membrane protein assembly factor BamE [Yoonia sp. SS1-5]|uniref:Outer membrane protein assembly factor BamE n=1 Tax=Yoonia rhodophyticola TaxID=3137370 RepID=A0AAN0M828_9RHOB